MNKKIVSLFVVFLGLMFFANACSSASAPVQMIEEPLVSTETTSPTLALTTEPIRPTEEKIPVESPSFNSNASLTLLDNPFLFAEGPATDKDGHVYFSDITAGRIYKWSPDGSVVIFLEGLNMPNGLMFDGSGNLIACEGGNGRLISIDPQGSITVVVDQYNGIRFNEPNDLWIDPLGGIYFTDPVYQSSMVQEGEHVYYLSPDRTEVSRVINDFVRPNGIVGTSDGKVLYVSDHGAGQIFAYDINSDGSLTNKRLFVPTGSDGMTLDFANNLYLTTQNAVQVYDPSGNLLLTLPTQENPTNVTFAGEIGRTLFITARSAVYTLQLFNEGTAAASSFSLTSPEVAAGGALPVEYTCDGGSATLTLNWSGAPEGTVGYALIMHHVAGPDDVHWYWVLYNIPVEVTSLAKNSTGIGNLGTNSVNDRNEYSPPCSKGPGDKNYTYTLYALSAQPQFSNSASKIDRDALLAAIADITLTSSELNVTYARP
ncbi:MAG: SMP-30/gluconolactonase/LRE family protein [Chloroflexi bacterium]|nr:SMP-30/gluconolactonase/LRE family protein [Chloroflexota bacterium]